MSDILDDLQRMLDRMRDPGIAQRELKAAVVEWWGTTCSALLRGLASVAAECDSFEMFAKVLPTMADEAAKEGKRLAEALRAIDKEPAP